jgi:predicted RNA-binding protein YlxR (DUF448 family)
VTSAAARLISVEDEMRERRCIVTGEVLPESRLIRFVAGPDGSVVPDLGAELPGRGMWVSADRGILERAVARNAFSKAAKSHLRADEELPVRVECLLIRRMQDNLGLARRSGTLVMGYDNVSRALASARKPTILVEAGDGAPDGRRKVLAAARAQGIEPAILDCLRAEELSVALGRENVIHAALLPGPLADRLILDAKRLEGFRVRVMIGGTGPNPVRNERRK